MVSRLHAKTHQIGKLLSNLEKFNHHVKDNEFNKNATAPGGSSRNASNPSTPKEPQAPARPKSICVSSEVNKPSDELHKNKAKTPISDMQICSQTSEKSETNKKASTTKN